jgi:uncharacterized protein (DUF1810 family)
MRTAGHDLRRFLEAQDRVLSRVRAELQAGHKRSHWMWFVFPQLAGLGTSASASAYAISSLDEARAYLAHELLGARLRECTQLVNEVQGRTIEQIFGYPDYLKFRSCMTLFAHAAAAAGDADGARVFRAALEKYFAAEEDPLTRGLLSPWAS